MADSDTASDTEDTGVTRNKGLNNSKRSASEADAGRNKKNKTDDNETLTLDEFWDTIEQAWGKADASVDKHRRDLFRLMPDYHRPNEDGIRTMSFAIHPFQMLPHLRTILDTFMSRQLEQWDDHLWCLLYDLDSERVHRVLGGNNEDFQRSRAYVVCLGKAYYEAVKNNPTTYGLSFTNCSHFLDVGCNVYREKFGVRDWISRPCPVPRFSFSNKALYSPSYIDGGTATNLTHCVTNADDHQAAILMVALKAWLSHTAVVTTNVFWASIETAWSNLDGPGHRAELAAPSVKDRQALAEHIPVNAMVVNLRAILERYTAAQLRQWESQLHLILFSLDRQDLCEQVQGTDHTFIGLRSFFVACGKAYYDAVQADIAYATRRWSVDLAWLVGDVGKDTHGDEYKYDETIPLATGSNKGMWPSRRR